MEMNIVMKDINQENDIIDESKSIDSSLNKISKKKSIKNIIKDFIDNEYIINSNIYKDTQANGWSYQKSQMTSKFLFKLNYNREINNFFFFDLKSREDFWSWAIIVLSTITSSLTLLNNIEREPFIFYFIILKIILGCFAVTVTLIAAWMKKQQYVERINIIDRYLQKINILIEDLNIQLNLPTEDRLRYSDFKKKFHESIKLNLSTSPAMSPLEWKRTVYKITKYYPELINKDGLQENMLWPWYGYKMNKETGSLNRYETTFGKQIKSTYHLITYSGTIKRYVCPCLKSKTKYIHQECEDCDIEKGIIIRINDLCKHYDNLEYINMLFFKNRLKSPMNKSNIINHYFRIIKINKKKSIVKVKYNFDKKTEYWIPLKSIKKINIL